MRGVIHRSDLLIEGKHKPLFLCLLGHINLPSAHSTNESMEKSSKCPKKKDKSLYLREIPQKYCMSSAVKTGAFLFSFMDSNRNLSLG